jgi:DNA-binding NtrC family response regulator
MVKRLLIVEPDPAYASELAKAALDAGWLTISHSSFAGARRELTRQQFDAVLGNIRLGGFNGVHLAYVAKQGHAGATVILYCATNDPVLVREARSAGAFYEPMDQLILALPAYLAAAELPEIDRRGVEVIDRRQAFDGGRRMTDARELGIVNWEL